jgi:O-antigen/teichoic acid export membrane protein
MTASLRTPLRKIAADTSISFGLKILAVPIAYFTPLVVARLYGAELMGTYAITAYLVVTIAVLCRLGLDTGLMRFVAVLAAQGQMGGWQRLFWPAFGLVTLCSGLAAVALYSYKASLVQWFHAPHLAGIIGFAALALPLAVITSMCAETLRALGGVRWVIFQHNLLSPLAFLLLIVIFAYFGQRWERSVQDLGLAFLLSTIIGLGVIILALFYYVRAGEEHASGQHNFKDLLHYSWPLFLTSILFLSFSGLDSLILGWYTSPTKVAYYEAATKIAALVGFPLIVVNGVVPPSFAQLHQLGDLRLLEKVARSTARWTYYLALPLTLISTLLAVDLLGFLGPGFGEGQWALRILVVAQLISVASGSVGLILSMTGHQLTFTILQAMIGVIGIPLIALAAPAYGLTGVALVRGLWLIGLNIVTSLAVWRCLKIKAFANNIYRANLGALLGVALYFLLSPFIGSWGGAAFFLIGYLACTARTLKQELAEILQSSRHEVPLETEVA